MRHIKYTKRRYISLVILFMVIVVALIILPPSLVSNAPLRDLLMLWFIVLSVTASVGGLAGWLFVKLIIEPRITSPDKKPGLIENRANLSKELYTVYDLHIDDVLVYHLYDYYHSPQKGRIHRLTKFIFLFAAAVELFAAVVLVAVFSKQYLTLILVLCAFALLTFLYYIVSTSLVRKGLKGTVARNYGQGKDKLTGKHRISISLDAITDITDMGESTTHWGAVEWIASTDQYLFMTVRGSGPLIVPRRSFTDEAAFSKFVNTAKAYHQSAEAGNPPTFKLK